MSNKIKKIIEDKLLNNLNNIVIWSYINCGDRSYKIISTIINNLASTLEKLNLINRRIK